MFINFIMVSIMIFIIIIIITIRIIPEVEIN